MSVENIQSFIHIAASSWMAGDPDTFAQLFTPDGEFIVPGQVWIGRSNIRQAAVDFAATHSNVKIVIHRILVEGEQAVVEWFWEDTDDASQQRNQADDAIVVDFRDGLICRWREYIDVKTPQQQTES